MAMPFGLSNKVSRRGSLLILLFAIVAGHGSWYSYQHIQQVGAVAVIEMYAHGVMTVFALVLFFMYPRK